MDDEDDQYGDSLGHDNPHPPRVPDYPSRGIPLVGGWDGAGHIHRHPALPGLTVETSPGSMRGELRLAWEWPDHLQGRTFLDVGGVPPRWTSLRMAGTALPAEVRRQDHRTVVLRWLEPSAVATGSGPTGPGGLAASLLSGAAVAAVAVWRRRQIARSR